MIGWLTSKVGVFILAGVLVVVSAAALIDGIRNRSAIRSLEGFKTELQAQLKTANENLGTCHANVGTLGAAVDRQGAMILALGESTKAAGDRAAAAAQAAAANSKAARDSAQRVLDLPRPPPDMACTEAARLLRGEL